MTFPFEEEFYINAVSLEEHKSYFTKRGIKKRYRSERKGLFNGECSYCGDTPDHLTLDHFIPKSASGRHHFDNLVPACVHCNNKKGSENAYDWYRKQTFYDPDRWNLILTMIGKQELNQVTQQEDSSH